MRSAALHRAAFFCRDIRRLCNPSARRDIATTASSVRNVVAGAPTDNHDHVNLSLWRGGTSKGLFLNESTFIKDVFSTKDIQKVSSDWLEKHRLGAHAQRHIASLLGSPDPQGRQLDGLGGGISSLSKAVMISDRLGGSRNPKSPHVAYTFLQVGVQDGAVDMSGNCGNLTSAVGPYAIDLGHLRRQYANILDYNRASWIKQPSRADRCAVPATVNLLNSNTNKIIRSTFMVSQGQDLQQWKFEPRGNFAMPGVPGRASEISLQFLNPGGSKTSGTLPTGNPVDSIEVADRIFAVSLVDISNPGIFIDGRELGWDPTRKPTELDADTTLMATLEQIRRMGARMMGLDPDKPSIPKIVLVFPSENSDIHVHCQALSMGKAHKAVPGTLALNLGAACQIPGTIPNQLARHNTDGKITIGHPTGTAETAAKIHANGHVDYVEYSRTARCLIDGLSYNLTSDNVDYVPLIDKELAIERRRRTESWRSLDWRPAR